VRRVLPRLTKTGAWLLAATLALAPIGGSAAGEPVTVPVVLSETGPFALIGKVQRLALETLMKTVNAQGGINSRPLQFEFLDDASTAANSVQLTNRLVNEKVPVMIGPSFVATCRAVAPLVTAGPVQYCMSPAGPTPKDGFSFVGGMSNAASARVSLNYFRGRGWHRLALFTPTDATGQEGEQDFNEAVASPAGRGMTIVVRDHFNISDISVAAQIARIQAAKPDVVIAWTTGAPLGTVLRGLQFSGYSVPVITSWGNLLYSAMNQFGDLAPPAGLFFTAPRFLAANVLRGADRNAVDTFVKAMEGANLRPDAVLATEWDVGLVVVDALQHAGPNPTADQVRRYIEGIHGLPGAAATFDFRDGSQRGVSPTTIVVGRWDPVAKTFVAASAPGGKPLSN
jgi:branched-chain amino acid transport system substrate-binding protein